MATTAKIPTYQQTKQARQGVCHCARSGRTDWVPCWGRFYERFRSILLRSKKKNGPLAVLTSLNDWSENVLSCENCDALYDCENDYTHFCVDVEAKKVRSGVLPL